MNLWFEYAFAVEGVQLVVTVRWYTSADPAAQPVLTDVSRQSLTDTAVTPESIYQRVRDRAGEVRRGLALYQAVIGQFGAAQGTRIAAP